MLRVADAEAALRNPVLAALGRDAATRLLELSELRRYRARERVLAEGDPADTVYALVRGAVRVYHRSPEGLEVLLKAFRPPAVFGEMECLVGIAYLEHVETLEPTTLCEIPGAEFRRALAEAPAAAMALLTDVCARLCVACQNEKALAFYSVRARLAHLLVTETVFDGLPAYGGARSRLPLSQEAMAHALGVTRRAVAKEMARWQRLGVIVREGRTYHVPDVTRLASEAGDLKLGLLYRIGRPALLEGAAAPPVVAGRVA